MCNYHNGLKVCHINAGSLKSKHTILYQLLSTSKMDVIMVSESWLNLHIPSSFVSIPGFLLYRNDRKDRVGGGVCVFVKENLHAKSVFSSSLCPIEFVCIEIKNESEKCLLVTVYCPPCKFKDENIKEFEETLIRLSRSYTKILIGGDFNVNYLEKNASVSLFQYICDKIGLVVINQQWPTCFQSVRNPSLIDMFLTNSIDDVLGNDQLRLTSDFIHDLIFCSFSFNFRSNSVKTLRFRSINQTDLLSLHQNISRYGLFEIYNASDIDSKVSLLTQITAELYDEYVPVVTKVLKPQSCPWFNPQIKKLIKERERFFKKYKRNRTEYNRCQYIYARNKVTSHIRYVKRTYLMKRLDPNLNSKALWKNLKNYGVIDSEKSQCSFSPNEMSLVLVPDSSEAISFEIGEFSSDDCFELRCASDLDVEKAVRSIKSNAVGPDDLSPKFIKLILPLLLPYLVHIFNYCIYSRQFPVKWKNAKVVPIPKKPNPKSPSEFRPISLLSFLSKTLEKILAEQVQESLNRHNSISIWQSGFRKKHSCESAVLKVTSDLRRSMDRNEISLMVMLDFSKAFDCIDHSILLGKLKNNFNFSCSALQLISSYLKNRLLRVETELGKSNPLLVYTAVPQGSV